MSEIDPKETGNFSAEEWEAIKESVYVCAHLTPEERQRYLDQNCQSPRIKREMERLLRASSSVGAFLQTPAASLIGDLPPAKTRIGPFRVVREVGQGGMGVVYEAYDDRLERRVALKVLHPEIATDADLRERLIWDARAASRLSHPNVVTVYEVGSHGGVDYVAMEFISGQNLAEILQNGKLSRSRSLELARQIASGLEAAHAAGIVHRDLKPANIIVSEDNVVKLVDFGLAKSISGQLGGRQLPETVQGGFAGTVAYASPEQAEGRAIDGRSDVFSFGSVLYEMLTGRRAFPAGNPVSVLARIIHVDPEPPSHFDQSADRRLDDILMKCLHKLPEKRFQTMTEVKIRLQEVGSTTWPSIPRNLPWRRIAAVALGLCAAAVLTVPLYRYTRHKPEVRTQSAALTKMTSDPGLTAYPAISPDGKLMAYASDRGSDGNLNIWVQQLGGGDPVRMTSDPADNYAPAFSPDSTHIAYRSDRRGGGIYLSPTFSNSEELLVRGGYDPKFSPDGARIACWQGYVGGSLYAGSAHVVIVSVATKETNVFRPDFENAAYPIWISDSKILFLGAKKLPGKPTLIDWWVADINGTTAKPTGALARIKKAGLVAPPDAFWIKPDARMPGGDAVFTATLGDATNVWHITPEVEGQNAGEPVALTNGASFDAWASVAMNEGTLKTAFSSLSVAIGVWKLPLTASSAAAGPAERLLTGYSDINSPTVSADGRTLAVAVRQPAGQRILTLDTKTLQPHVLSVLPPLSRIHPVISGDGRLVAFYGSKGAYVVPVEDGVVTPLCENCGVPTHLTFDGDQVLFESANADERLQLWSNGKVGRLTPGVDPNNEMQFGGHFSPDGKWVAYCKAERGQLARRVVVVPNAPGRGIHPDEWIMISDGSDSDRLPVWSPDGRQIYYLSDRDGFRCIWARTVDPATAHPIGPSFAVAHFHHAGRTMRGLKAAAGNVGLSAASGFLVFTMAEMTGNIWMEQFTKN
jgi:serine/threonine protein kinase/Tol biopolymer transport system component